MFIDTDLAYRIEKIQAQHQVAITEVLRDRFTLTSAQNLSLMGGYAIFQGQAYPTNHALCIGFQTNDAEEELAQLERFYWARGAPSTIEVCPFVAPAFMQLLGKRAYTVERFYNTYVRPLPPDATIAPLAAEIEIHQASAIESELWAQTVAGTAQPNDPVSLLAQATFHAPDVRCLLASLDGAVAGGGAVAITDDIAYFTFMGTRPASRQRGVQQALLSARLAAATHARCTLAICNTVPGSQSQRNVLRAGFTLAYTKVFLRKDPHV